MNDDILERKALQEYYEEILASLVETQEIVENYLTNGEEHVRKIEEAGQYLDRGCSAKIIQFPIKGVKGRAE